MQRRERKTLPEVFEPDETMALDHTLADVVRNEWVGATPSTPHVSELEGLSLVGELGRGGMGVVYRAVQKALNREVAVKLLDPANQWTNSQYERFYQEVKLAASLNHPNVAHIHWVKREGTLLYFVMEFIHGHSLAELLTTKAFAPADLVHVFMQVCDGLEHAHARGIVHRDLKPGNILVEAGPSSVPRTGAPTSLGRAVLVDFGLAARSGESSLTEDGLLMGTPAYMSPEQANGDSTDERTDLYSLGVSMFEALTGRVPFSAPTPLAMALKHVAEPPPDPRSIVPSTPTVLAELTNALLEKDKDNRPASAGEVRERLRAALATRLSVRSVPTSADFPNLTQREVALLTVSMDGFRSAAIDQPLPRTAFQLESWTELVRQSVEPLGGTLVRREAAVASVVFNWPQRTDGFTERALAAIDSLVDAVASFNKTHGTSHAFTAGLECGDVFVGQLEGAGMTCFGTALNLSIALGSVRNCGVGVLGPRAAELLQDRIALEPLIGAADELGAAYRIVR